MLTAFFLGLAGSLSHCVGMCGAVLLLVGGRAPTARRLLLAQLGRLASYATLGGLAGALGSGADALLPHAGHQAAAPAPGLRLAQGGLALLVAATALYMALALLGRAPSPELALARLTQAWGRTMRRLGPQLRASALGGLAAGLLWGLLPCGLVLTALLLAAAAGSPARGGLAMLAFGLGTLPALLGVGWLGRAGRAAPWLWPRQAAALLVLLFGAQMALRGLAAWGWVGHLSIEGVMLW